MILLFRIIAFLEGLSYIFLLFIATPIKYILENDTYVKLLGMPHGILFIIYLVFAVYIKSILNLNMKTFLFICIAAFVPFGTFYIELKYLNKY